MGLSPEILMTFPLCLVHVKIKALFPVTIEVGVIPEEGQGKEADTTQSPLAWCFKF